MEPFSRITRHPETMGGRACIRGLRVTVGMVVSQVGAGHTIDEILSDNPYLERDDIMQALRYAELEQGALLTVDPKRTRLRLLPL